MANKQEQPTGFPQFRGPIRLACGECDRQDFDGITEVELRACIKAGWRHVTEEQPFKESYTNYQTMKGSPVDDGIWYTHVGTCPDCCHANSFHNNGLLF